MTRCGAAAGRGSRSGTRRRRARSLRAPTGGAAEKGTGEKFGEALYAAEDAASCPTRPCSRASAAAIRPRSPSLHEGETVLDLGSGGGIDVILSARRVGPTGTAFGLDMTDEMLALAQHNAQEAGVGNAVFLKGVIEEIPLPGALGRRRDLELRDQPLRRQGGRADGDGPRAAARRPDRRLGRRGRGPPHTRGAGRAGLVLRLHRRRALEGRVRGRASKAAGFDDVSVEFTHQVAEGMHGAIVKARKPS